MPGKADVTVSSEPDASTISRQDRSDVVLVGVTIILLGLTLIPVQRRWAYSFQLVEYDRHFWMTMVMVFLAAVAAAEGAWRLVARRSCKLSPLIGFAMTIAAGNVFYPIANGALDRKPAEQRVYVIESRYCYRGWRKARDWPRLRLRPVDHTDRGGFRLRVSASYCRAARDGQELLVDVKPGFLNTAWAAHYELRP